MAKSMSDAKTNAAGDDMANKKRAAAEETEAEDAKKFRTYFSKNRLPFIGLPDPKHQVLKKYGQEVKLFKFGRMPAQLLIDKAGTVRFVHYGHSMR